GEEDPPDDAGDPSPEEEDEDQRDAPLVPLPEQSRSREQDGEQGPRPQEGGDAHEEVVQPAAVVAGDRPDHQADERRQDGDEDTDLHRGPDSPDDAGELITSEGVRTEPVRMRRALEDVREVDLRVRVRRDDAREDPGAEDDHQSEQPGQREAVAEEAHARVRPLAASLELETG